MDSWSAFKTAINPFSLAARRGVLPGKGPGRVVIFACDSSSNRSLPSYLIVLQLVPQLSSLCVFSWLCAWSLFWFLSCSPAPLSHSLPTTHSLSTLPVRPLALLPPLLPPRKPNSEAAVRFGLDNVVRANDSCSFVCAYKKAATYDHDPGPFMEGKHNVSAKKKKKNALQR